MLLGLDIGTTNIKALLVRDDGSIAARGSVPVTLRHVADGGVEQSIEEIWRATLSAIWLAGRDGDLAAVRAVGVSSQGGAIQLRGPGGRCAGPVISWMDPRGAPFDEEFGRAHDATWLVPRIGHGRSGMVIGQTLRLRREAADVLAPPAAMGFVGDEIVRRLCGRPAHDGSSLSICCLYNPATRRADPDVLAAIGVRPDQLPELLPAHEPAGALNEDAARQVQLPVGIPVGPAVHDQYAAALGCGAIDAGDVMFGAGTAWVLLAIGDRLLPPVVPEAWVCNHVVPDRWGQLLSLVVGGSAFRWAVDLVGAGERPPEKIDEMMESVPAGCDGLRLWPFLDGLGGANRPTGGSLRNVRLSHGPAHLLRATVEGLCFELARQLGWLERAGCPARRLILCGGAARSRVTPRIVAGVTGRPVTIPEQTDISALGAAILARSLVDRDTPIADLSRAMSGRARVVDPDDAHAAYAEMARAYEAAIAAQ